MVSRHEAVAILEDGQNRLDELFERLDNGHLGKPATIGSWAAKDLMGHIAFWEELALQALDRCRGGLSPFPDDLTTEQRNDRNQQEQARLSPSQLRSRFGSSHAALISAIGTLTDAEWHAPADGDTPLGDVLGGVLGAENRPFGHAFHHLDELDAYVNSVVGSSA